MFRVFSKVLRRLSYLDTYFTGRQKHLKLIRKNRSFWRKYLRQVKFEKDSVVIVEAGDQIFYYGYAFLASVVAKAKNSRLIFLDPGYNIALRSLNKSFHAQDHVLLSSYAPNKNWQELAAEVLRNVKSPEDILQITYHGLRIGDLIYDNALRAGQWQATIRSVDDRVIAMTAAAIRNIEALESLSTMHNVKATCFSHSVGINSGLILKFFAAKGVMSFCGGLGIGGTIIKCSHLSGLRFPTSAKLTPKFIEEALSEPSRTKILKKANEYLTERFSGQTKDFDSPKAFSNKKQIYSIPQEFCERYNLEPDKPLVFVMLHAFNDYPHHYERNIFIDYYTWFIQTLQIVLKNNRVNWIFKEHPNGIYYPDDSNLAGIFQVVEQPNILFLDKDENFNTASLKDIADCIVTNLGTAALEFSCFGIPAIICGDNHFSGFGICHEPKTYEEYKDLLLQIEPFLENYHRSVEQTDLSKILLYVIYNFSFGQTKHNSSLLKTTHEERVEYAKHELIWSDILCEAIDSQEMLNLLKRAEAFVRDDDREMFLTTEDIIAS